MFGSATETPVTALLMGGVLPGILLAILLCGYAYYYARKRNIGGGDKFSIRECGRAFIKAIPALLVPIIILGGIYSGYFTPTESAAIAVVYSFFAGTVIYHELTFTRIKNALVGSGTQTGSILVIAAAATFFGRMLTAEQFQAHVENFAVNATDSKILILLVINLILLVLGCLMDTTPIILIFAPILLPIATAFGVNPVHFGVMMCINLALGLITPPVGISLYVAAGQAKLPVAEIVKKVVPPLGILLIGLLLITYIPSIVTLLPELAGIM